MPGQQQPEMLWKAHQAMAGGKDETLHTILTKPAETQASAGQTYNAKPLPGHRRQSPLRLLEAFAVC